MKKLTKKRQLFVYAFSGMGVNMLNLIVGSYLCDALMVEGFDKNVENWTYFNKTLVVAAVWSVMIALAKVIDGVIDIPLAAFTDNLKTKWGKRRPAILMGFIPMLLAFTGFLNPLSHSEKSLFNTLWLGLLLCLFYSFYTLTMVTYYATFSEITDSDENRVHLSNYKTVFDVIYFVLGYALIPALVGSMNIRTMAYIFLPFSLTMLIPIFMIKEDSTLGKTAEAKVAGSDDENVGLKDSVIYAFKNKSFIIWMAVYAALQFGLQLFITGQNVLYSGAMGFTGIKITVVNACAFGPVPFTLILYNKLVRNRGIKFGYIFSLTAFMTAMAVMAFCKPSVMPDETVRLIICCVAAIVASLGIGCFFSISYTIPSTIACIERREKGISHPAMFFAVQGLASGVSTAISTGIVWVNLKKAGDGAYVWVMPLIVVAACLISLIITLKLPAEISEIGKKAAEKEQ